MQKRIPIPRWRGRGLLWLLALTAALMRSHPPQAGDLPPTLDLDSEPKHTLYGKVARVEREKGEFDVILIVQPKETRFTLEQPAATIRLGDYVKFIITKNKALIERAQHPIRGIRWTE